MSVSSARLDGLGGWKGVILFLVKCVFLWRGGWSGLAMPCVWFLTFASPAHSGAGAPPPFFITLLPVRRLKGGGSGVGGCGGLHVNRKGMLPRYAALFSIFHVQFQYLNEKNVLARLAFLRKSGSS